MKKLIKKILIISQVLGWSALVASACTDNNVNNTTKNSNESAPQDAKTNDQHDPTIKHNNKDEVNKDGQSTDPTAKHENENAMEQTNVSSNQNGASSQQGSEAQKRNAQQQSHGSTSVTQPKVKAHK